jgi:hypothetical protein
MIPFPPQACRVIVKSAICPAYSATARQEEYYACISFCRLMLQL